MSEKMVLKNIEKNFKGKSIFKNVNITLEQGEMCAIKGKSGVGKSTLLNILAGLETPSAGNYFFKDVDLAKKGLHSLATFRREHVGYISQFSPMIPKLTVYENICVPTWFEKKREHSDSTYQTVLDLSERFEIQHLLDNRIESLSGGEIQRVGIIRSLINNPDLVIADEPTGALDDETAMEVLSYFQILKKNGIKVIIATHSASVAERCDQIYQLTSQGLSKNGEFVQ